MTSATRPTTQRSAKEFAQMIAAVASSVNVDAVVCVTERKSLINHVCEATRGLRVIAASHSKEVCEDLVEQGHEVVRLPAYVASKLRQAQHAVSVAVHEGMVSPGDLVACAVGHIPAAPDGNVILLMDIGPDVIHFAVHELVRLTDGVKPDVLEAALSVACRIGQAARRGKRIGALFTIGDSDKVLRGARQLVLNPFQGHDESQRLLTDPSIHEMLVELAKLDGAFVVRGDGLIRSAGVFLAAGRCRVQLPRGLGARHTTAAKVSCDTKATAVTVSATDGFVRVFCHGKIVLKMDPDVPFPSPPGTTGT